MYGAQSVAETAKGNNLNDAERSAVIAELLKGSSNEVLRKVDLGRVTVAESYRSNRWTMVGLWKEYERQKAAGVFCPDLLDKRRGDCGQHGINLESLHEAPNDIPIKSRKRTVAAALGIPNILFEVVRGTQCMVTWHADILHWPGGTSRLESVTFTL